VQIKEGGCKPDSKPDSMPDNPTIPNQPTSPVIATVHNPVPVTNSEYKNYIDRKINIIEANLRTAKESENNINHLVNNIYNLRRKY
jgi:hypothetical protein